MTSIAVQPGQAADSKLPGDYELKDADDTPDDKVHDLDTQEAMAELARCEDWYCESNEALAEEAAQVATDFAYYDHLQYTEAEKQEMLSRGQAPLVFNKCSILVDWITGTERRTRIDFQVHPKRKENEASADVKTKLLKYESDTNLIGFNRSAAFKSAVICGLGWTEADIRGDLSQDIVLHGDVPYQQVKRDPFSRKLDLDDARYLHRRQWIDYEFAIAQFPGREDVLRRAARSHVFGDEEFWPEMLDLPQCYRRYDSTGAELVQRRWSGSIPIIGSTHRLRVPITRTWYRQPRRIKRIWGNELNGVEFDPANIEMAEAVKNGYAGVSDAVTTDMRLAMWVPGGMLWSGLSPFRHGGFPLTPIWAKRRNDDGSVYGVIRGMRDGQDDYNKRKSKQLWLLSSNQFIYEESAVDEDELPDIKRNLAKPNGMVKLRDGALSGNKVQIERNLELAAALGQVLKQDAADINDVGGVNRENRGADTNATSGRAIIAKQQEGAVTTADLFDNLRLAVQLDGKKVLSICEQFMSLPMQIRVTGDGPTAKRDWIEINKPVFKDGRWEYENDITQEDADFTVDQIDFRETVRQAQAEQFWDMLGKMPEQFQVGLLDLAVEMTDMPQRDALVARIRKLNKQTDTLAQKDPATLAAEQQAQQEQDAQNQLAMRERLAKVGLDEAKAGEILAKAKAIGLESKGKSLDIARLIEILMPLAPAADRLYQSTGPET